jgi:hypothetical protein
LMTGAHGFLLRILIAVIAGDAFRKNGRALSNYTTSPSGFTFRPPGTQRRFCEAREVMLLLPGYLRMTTRPDSDLMARGVSDHAFF